MLSCQQIKWIMWINQVRSDKQAGSVLDFDSIDSLQELARILRMLHRRHAQSQRQTKLTMRELAARTGYAHGVIADYLNGTRLPPIDRFDALIVLFGASADEQRRLAEAHERVDEAIRKSKGAGVPSVVQASIGHSPAVWNVPVPSRTFIGREQLLADLGDALKTGRPVAVCTLRGIGGVGKTQTVLEFAHRSRAAYDLAWFVNAEQPELIASQLASLAVEAGLAEPQSDDPAANKALATYLSSRSGWLVVFDNATTPADLAAHVPRGPGHVIITSRHMNWQEVADDVKVDLFSRQESCDFLAMRLPALSSAETSTLAAALGDLPLALAQAAALMTETGMSAAEYLGVLASEADSVLDLGTPAGYTTSLAAVVRIARERLAAADQASDQLARLCSLFGPEPIPISLVTAAPEGLLPPPLSQTAGSLLAIRRALGRLAAFGLAQVSERAISMHRLTQSILRAQLDLSDRSVWRLRMEGLLVAAQPDNGADPALWPRWAELIPHILATDPATANEPMRELAVAAAWHLQARGDPATALPLVTKLYQTWQETDGPDAPIVLAVARTFAVVLYRLANLEESKQLFDDIYRRTRRLHGEDAPATLSAAANLAISLYGLGQFQQAKDLGEDALARCRRVLGPDDALTLRCAGNLLLNLWKLGANEAGKALGHDTLDRSRRVLGADNPATLDIANNLAGCVSALGQIEDAYLLHEDTYDRRHSVLGPDHPDTLASADNMVEMLCELRRYEEAQQLAEETTARCKAVLGDNHPNTLTALDNLAAVLSALGHHLMARRIYEDTYRRRTVVLGPEHPDTIAAATKRGI